jgi:copper oxidase (laccase) domain-containing protein
MRRTFDQAEFTVHCQYLGVASGGFSDDFNTDVADVNLSKLQTAFAAEASTRILPDDDYGVHLVDNEHAALPAAALVTDDFNHNLTLRPADCIPLVLTDRPKHLLALIHCGRRELDADSIGRTIALMSDQFGSRPEDLSAYLGPGIKARSYILPRDVRQSLDHPAWQTAVRPVDPENISLDLFGFAQAELGRLGVAASAITVSNIDTATNPLYFSYYGATRHDKPCGLNGFVVAMTRRSAAEQTLAA